MAFYKDMKHKTRQEKRVEAAARGGFEDEGAGYRKGAAQKGRAPPAPRRGAAARGSRPDARRSRGGPRAAQVRTSLAAPNRRAPWHTGKTRRTALRGRLAGAGT